MAVAQRDKHKYDSERAENKEAQIGCITDLQRAGNKGGKKRRKVNFNSLQLDRNQASQKISQQMEALMGSLGSLS